MMHKALFTFLLVSCIYNFGTTQDFQKEYFPFSDFSFIDDMQHADFNGDGLPDFLIGASNFGKLQVGINTGISAPIFTEITDITSIKNTAVADIDGDGDVDIIGLRQFSGVYAFINDGNAVFTSQQLNVGEYESIAFADITGDGSLEMIVGSFELSIYQINASTLDLTEIYSIDFGSGSTGALAVVDYDNDGDNDLISSDGSGLTLLLQTAPLVFESSILYTDNYSMDHITIVNLTNDGVIDFVLYDEDALSGKVVVSDVNGQYIEEGLSLDDVNNTLTLVGDFNEDEKEEIITFENNSFNDFAMYIKEYTTNLVNLEIIQDHFASYGGGVVDIDNDGDEDFYFFQNDVSSPGLIFYLNDGVLIDEDGDGFNSEEDCDDTNENVNPGQSEIPYNGLDDDCDPSSLDDDLDQDGFLLADDCNDEDASINPDADEIPNNDIDENCDDIIAAVHEIANTKINIFPNPATEFIRIDIDGLLEYSVTLFDLEGKPVLKSTNDKFIRINTIPNGIYLLEIQDQLDGHKIIEKIVIGR